MFRNGAHFWVGTYFVAVWIYLQWRIAIRSDPFKEVVPSLTLWKLSLLIDELLDSTTPQCMEEALPRLPIWLRSDYLQSQINPRMIVISESNAAQNRFPDTRWWKLQNVGECVIKWKSFDCRSNWGLHNRMFMTLLIVFAIHVVQGSAEEQSADYLIKHTSLEHSSSYFYSLRHFVPFHLIRKHVYLL